MKSRGGEHCVFTKWYYDWSGRLNKILRIKGMPSKLLKDLAVLMNLNGSWPSEDALAYYCLSHAELFRHKKVIELESGYGLSAFVIAAVTEALEVVISYGNPQMQFRPPSSLKPDNFFERF
ncbi:hypothetical protein K1719_023979 [Acacia pycnantha]|nr:hypothetical protein K1719_023979 [Acacia pycnantha]